MRRPTGRVATSIALVAVAATLTSASSVATPDRDQGAPELAGNLGRGAAASFARFALYSLGDSFEGLPLTAINRRDEARAVGERVRANYVGFIYGDCRAEDERGCAPPLEVQVWPACTRTLADYTLTPAGDPLPHEATFVRGVPAAWFEDGLRLELYTGDVTVVVFGLEQTQIRRAAAALRAANALASAAPNLPAPVPGAMAGTLSCA